MRIALAFFFFALPVFAADLTFKEHGKQTTQFTLPLLNQKIPVQNFLVWEPHQSKEVTYRGVDFNALLDSVYGEKWKQTEEILFTCSDGYQPSIPVSRFLKHKSFLVFERVDKNGKTEAFKLDNPMNQEKDVELAPFYLIWENLEDKEMREEGASGWPYQLVMIDLISFAEKFPQMSPPSKASAKAKEGFLLFRKHCLSCHTINGEGGGKAIELNYPMSVTEYFKSNLLERWLLDPASIRFSTAMPPFRGSKEQARKIIEYLRSMASNKRAPKTK